MHIQFKFVDTGLSDIHISFNKYGGSFSFIGTEAWRVLDKRATINLIIANIKSQIVECHILYKLRYIFDCIHKYYSPAVKISWNKKYVYSHFKGLGWNKETMNKNLFQEYTPEIIKFSLFNLMSIMIYSFEIAFTKDGYIICFSWDFFKTNKEFILKVYSKPKKLQINSSDGVEDQYY